jgi:hypothetical protein
VDQSQQVLSMLQQVLQPHLHGQDVRSNHSALTVKLSFQFLFQNSSITARINQNRFFTFTVPKRIEQFWANAVTGTILTCSIKTSGGIENRFNDGLRYE